MGRAFFRFVFMTLVEKTGSITEIPDDYISLFYGLFSGCTGLTAAPELPATKLARKCYMEMFSGCTNLVSAPELPATTLANYCYNGMFSGCTSLTSAPVLPVTTLANYCYREMFKDYIKADMFSLCAEILVVALYAITVICSAIMLLIGLVRLIIKKPSRNSFYKWNILTSATNILPGINWITLHICFPSLPVKI